MADPDVAVNNIINNIVNFLEYSFKELEHFDYIPS